VHRDEIHRARMEFAEPTADHAAEVVVH
jgi:hypothetical protein